MNSHPKHLLSRSHRHELVTLCNDLLVKAARDLAEFTKHGLNADFIVSLAHKCESLENMLRQPMPLFSGTELTQTEKEIRDAVIRICDTGRAIWNNNPRKYRDYTVTHMQLISFQPGPGSIHAA